MLCLLVLAGLGTAAAASRPSLSARHASVTGLDGSDSPGVQLAQLFRSTNGYSWTNKTGWAVANPNEQCYCAWFGVVCAPGCDETTCRQSGSGADGAWCAIVELRLMSNNLTGALPRPPWLEAGSFGSLRVLNLAKNPELAGEVPSNFWQLGNLTEFEVHRTSVNGSLPDFSNTPLLEIIDIDDARFSGPIPSSFYDLKQLRLAQLSRNHLTGNISADCRCLEKLEIFFVQYNALTGPVPSELFELNLQQLDLGYNLLTGPLPAAIQAGAASLTYFSGRKNQLSGPIPTELCRLTRLEVLSLAQNSLSGPIPDCLGNLTRLLRLNLSFNAQLSGTLPESLGQLQNLTLLMVSNCNVSGSIPASFGRMQSLEQLVVSDNSLAGQLPADVAAWQKTLRILDLSRNLYTGPLTQLMAPFFTVARLVRNNRAFVITQLLLSGNQLSGNIPTFEGLTSLRTIDLSFNKLDGVFENENQNGDLTTLDIRGNIDLHGALPANLAVSFPWLVNLFANETSLAGHELPSYVAFGKTGLVFGQIQCPAIVGSAELPRLQVTLPASYNNYNMCVCVDGMFGVATPVCAPCPDECDCRDGILSGCFPELEGDGAEADPGLAEGSKSSSSKSSSSKSSSSKSSSKSSSSKSSSKSSSSKSSSSKSNSKSSSKSSSSKSNGGIATVTQCPQRQACNAKRSTEFSCEAGYTERLCSKCTDSYAAQGTECVRCSSWHRWGAPCLLGVGLVALVVHVFRSGDSRSAYFSVGYVFLQTLALAPYHSPWQPLSTDLHSGVSTLADLSAAQTVQCWNSGLLGFAGRVYLTLAAPVGVVVFVVVPLCVYSVVRPASAVGRFCMGPEPDWSEPDQREAGGITATWSEGRQERHSVNWLHIDGGARPRISRARLRAVQKKAGAAVLLVANFFFFSVASKGLGALSCTLPGSGARMFLNAHPYVECTGLWERSEYQPAFVAGLLCLVYVGVFLGVVVRALWVRLRQWQPSQRAGADAGAGTATAPLLDTGHTAGERESGDPLGFLYAAFRDDSVAAQCWMLWITSKRLGVALLVELVPFHDTAKLYSGVFLVLLVATAAQAVVMPFHSPAENWLEFLAHVVLLLVFFAAASGAAWIQSVALGTSALLVAALCVAVVAAAVANQLRAGRRSSRHSLLGAIKH